LDTGTGEACGLPDSASDGGKSSFAVQPLSDFCNNISLSANNWIWHPARKHSTMSSLRADILSDWTYHGQA
jgi:hypothetical protein